MKMKIFEAANRLFPIPNMEKYARNTYSFMIAQTTIRIFYFWLLYASIAIYTRWDPGIGTQVKILTLWPVWWIKFVSFPIAFSVIKSAFIGATLLTAVFPFVRIFRVLTFVALLELVALYMTVLQADVDWHSAILVAFLLIFLPAGWNKFDNVPNLIKQKTLFLFWACQALTLLTYSMAGLGKILGAIEQYSRGQVHAFAPKAVALHAAERIIATNTVSPMGSLVVDHYLLAWPFFVGSIYLMVFAFWVAFRPRLHQFWGLGLILFHVASYLTMNISFFIHTIILAMFLLNSPFREKEVTLAPAIFELPLFGWIFKKIRSAFL